MDLYSIFQELKSHGLVRNQTDYCRNWLGVRESYFQPTSRKPEATPSVVIRLAMALEKHGLKDRAEQLRRVVLAGSSLLRGQP